ncbi:MAG TPA: cell division protein ZapA [Aquabacterium sp.]|uniref:cell division protein ZapA n=1 Tax=Aquabacterium sp. TaxID=1872578 RepID=UPI002E346B55|nr:cell division protein ZapA [Aquabacterium sp.]HEX5355607.1 cell division protein ZapA [Aquabacterium sp.]
MKQIEVSIMGQSYLLGCPEGGEERLKEAVHQVDREMCAIRDSGKLKARERIAVLAALNLAYMLTERPAAPAKASVPATQSAPELPSPEYIDNLISRLDQALDSDGHLI